MARIQIKRGLAASWTSANPILATGEIGLETDTGRIKIGTGLAAWTALGYYLSAADKGVNGGIASLDSEGLVPLSQLPITTADWETLDGKPAVVAAGATKAEARTAIDAAELDSGGKVPLTQLPAGSFVDGVTVVGDAFQLYSGDDPVGDPVSLLIAVVDGGSPSTTSEGYIDGGTL
jgi:hypothetical protein